MFDLDPINYYHNSQYLISDNSMRSNAKKFVVILLIIIHVLTDLK